MWICCRQNWEDDTRREITAREFFPRNGCPFLDGRWVPFAAIDPARLMRGVAVSKFQRAPKLSAFKVNLNQRVLPVFQG